MNWAYNFHDDGWEAIAGGWRARIEIPPDWPILTAYVEPYDRSGPRQIAPRAFDELQKAEAWCKGAIELLS